jgi:hypothetical protein
MAYDSGVAKDAVKMPMIKRGYKYDSQIKVGYHPKLGKESKVEKMIGANNNPNNPDLPQTEYKPPRGNIYFCLLILVW